MNTVHTGESLQNLALEKGELQMVWVDPTTIKENPHNWRTHPEAQSNALSGVLEEVGWAGVALYNLETERLIDGHLRQKVATKRGENMPVLIGRWSEADELKILATLDPIAAMAEADAIALKAAIGGIQTENAQLQDMLSSLALEYNIADTTTQIEDNEEIDLNEFDEVNETNILYRVTINGLDREQATEFLDEYGEFCEMEQYREEIDD